MLIYIYIMLHILDLNFLPRAPLIQFLDPPLVHARMLYRSVTACAYGLAAHTPYSRRPTNGCSATGPFAVQEGKMFMLGIAFLLIIITSTIYNWRRNTAIPLQ